MKKITLIILMFVSFSTFAQEDINWVTLEQAVELQKQQPRKIIIDFYTVWCGPCKMLSKQTFGNSDVAKYINEHFYAVKFNAEGNDMVNFKGRKFSNPKYDPAKAHRRNYPHQLNGYFKVRAYPSIVYLDEQANLLTKTQGFMKPQQIELYLKMFANDEHLQFKTQQEFQDYAKAFKPEFK